MVDLDFIIDCLIVYKSHLFFDGADGLREKVSKQIDSIPALKVERDALKAELEEARKREPVQKDAEVTPEMIRAAQLNTEIGGYICANWAGAYDCLTELYTVMNKASHQSR